MKLNAVVLDADLDDDSEMKIVLEITNIDMQLDWSSARLLDRDGRKWKIVAVALPSRGAFEAGWWFLSVAPVDHDGVLEEGMKLLLEYTRADW